MQHLFRTVRNKMVPKGEKILQKRLQITLSSGETPITYLTYKTYLTIMATLTINKRENIQINTQNYGYEIRPSGLKQN